MLEWVSDWTVLPVPIHSIYVHVPTVEPLYPPHWWNRSVPTSGVHHVPSCQPQVSCRVAIIHHLDLLLYYISHCHQVYLCLHHNPHRHMQSIPQPSRVSIVCHAALVQSLGAGESMATHHLDLLLYYIPTTLHVYPSVYHITHSSHDILQRRHLNKQDTQPPSCTPHTWCSHIIRYIESAWVQK